MKTRVISAVVFSALTILMFLLNDTTRVVFIAILAIIACYEMNKAMRAKHEIAVWPGYAFIVAFIVIDVFGFKFDYVFFSLIIIMIGLFFQKILTRHLTLEEFFISLGICIYPVAPCMLIFHIVWQRGMYWPYMLVVGLIAAIINDTFALLGGMLFGKHKLAPTISPKKTVEGFVSGLIFGTLSGILVFALFSIGGWEHRGLAFTLAAAFCAAFAGVFGDLAASAIKRDVEIKDFGKILPGHGGILDRIDSIIFGIAAVYIVFDLATVFS